MTICKEWLRSAARGTLAAAAAIGGMTPALAYNVNATGNVTASDAVIPATAFGVHTSVYDNNFDNTTTPARLNAIGVNTLRWPGGGYADVYHWSTNANTQFENSGSYGYLAPNTDIGHFVRLLLSVTQPQAVITVNYGSSLDGAHGGQPKEAAALVAYLNGSPSSSQSIGIDGAGHDWHTVGYWAALRSAAPLGSDDGLNFLRIAHVQPIGVKNWEIGN